MSDRPASYARRDLEWVPAVGGGLIGRDRAGAYVELPAAIVEFLNACQGCRPLRDHADASINRMTLRDRLVCMRDLVDYARARNLDIVLGRHAVQRTLTAVLEDLASRGLLCSGAEISECVDTSPPEEPPVISGLGIVTCNRVEPLLRGLSSYIDNCLAHGHDKVVFSVFDDSDEPQTRTETRKRLAQLSRTRRVAIEYAGAEEKREFIAALEREGVPPAVARFALLGPSDLGLPIGANRNCLQLHTVGRVMLSVDDDTVCRVSRSPKFVNEVAVVPEKRLNVWHFAQRSDALRFAPECEADLLGLHRLVLGSSVASALQRLKSDNAVDMQAITASQVSDLCRGRGRILMSYNGWVGDCASMPSAYAHTGDARARVLASEAAYRLAASSLEVCKVADQWQLASGTGSMTTFYGVDNRSVLPPFVPALRAEDAVWGELVRVVVSDAASAALPWALLHEPAERRQYASTPGPFRLSMNEILTRFVAESGAGLVGPPRLRLRSVGTALRNLGAVSRSEFRKRLGRTLLRQIGDRLSRLQALLDEHRGSSPRFWVDDVQRAMGRIEAAAVEPALAIPSDVLPGRPPDERIARVQRHIGEFGAALVHWPAMVDVAKELRQRGAPLARRVAASNVSGDPSFDR